jgi:RimJ/RimL family protein N-acetyltransferase
MRPLAPDMHLVAHVVHEIVFADPTVTTCFIDPDARNRGAIRAYEKAGFRFVRDVADDGGGDRVHLMAMDRPR